MKKKVNTIQNIRKKNIKKENSLRMFVVPNVNFKAKNYTEMIPWNEHITGKPLTKNLINEQLQMFVENASLNNKIFQFPCHKQTFERCVKLVSESPSKVCDDSRREACINNVFADLEENKSNDSKHFVKEFTVRNSQA